MNFNRTDFNRFVCKIIDLVNFFTWQWSHLVIFHSFLCEKTDLVRFLTHNMFFSRKKTDLVNFFTLPLYFNHIDCKIIDLVIFFTWQLSQLVIFHCFLCEKTDLVRFLTLNAFPYRKKSDLVNFFTTIHLII